MPDASSEFRIRIVTTQDSAGTDKALSDIQRAGQAVAAVNAEQAASAQKAAAAIMEASAATSAASAAIQQGSAAVASAQVRTAESAREAAAAIAEAAASTSRAVAVAEEYGVSIGTAAEALQSLGLASKTAALGSAELDEAIGAVQAQALNQEGLDRAAAAARMYGTTLEVAIAALESLNPASEQAALGSTEVAAAMTKATVAAEARAAAYTKLLAAKRAVTLAEMAQADAEERSGEQAALAAAAAANLGAVSETVVAAMTKLGISQAAVAETSALINESLDTTARAMIKLAVAARSTQVDKAADAIAALGKATTAEAASQDVATVSTAAHNETMAKQAILARRTSDGLVDLAMGGRRAIQGVSDLQYVLMRLFPEGAATIGVVAGMILIGEVWEHITNKMARDGDRNADSQKTAADKAKQAWTDSNEVFDAMLKAIGKNDIFANLTSDAKKFSDQLHEQEDSVHELQAALDRLGDAKFGASEALLNRQEQIELKGKSGEDAEAIRQKYSAKRDEMTQAHDVEKAKRDADEAQAKVIDLQNQITDLKKQQADLRADIGKAYEQNASGANLTPEDNVPESDYDYAERRTQEIEQQAQDAANKVGDANGNFIKPPTDQDWNEYAGLHQSLPALKAQQDAKGRQYADQIKRANAEIDKTEKQEGADLGAVASTNYELAPGETQDQARAAARAQITAQYEQKIQELQDELKSMTSAQDVTAKLDDQKESDKTLADLQAKLDALEGPHGKLAAAKVDAVTAGVKVQTAVENQGTSVLTDQNKGDDFKRQVQEKTESEDIEAQIKTAQSRLLLAQTPLQKESAQDYIDFLQKKKTAMAEQNELAGETSFPALQSATKAKYDAEAGSFDAKGTATASREDTAALRREIEQLKAQIAARPDHAALEPFVKNAEATKDLTVEAQQLQQIQSSQVGSLTSSVETLHANQQHLKSNAARDSRRIDALERKIKNNALH